MHDYITPSEYDSNAVCFMPKAKQVILTFVEVTELALIRIPLLFTS